MHIEIIKKTIQVLLAILFGASQTTLNSADLEDEFNSPPNSARPWVYWINMDGHLNKEGITADLESMKAVGINGVIYMDVDVGVPRGPVPFMSETWQKNITHAVHECERLGLEFTTLLVQAGPVPVVPGLSQNNRCNIWFL